MMAAIFLGAADKWDSARFTGIFRASAESRFQAWSTPALAVTQAVGVRELKSTFSNQ